MPIGVCNLINDTAMAYFTITNYHLKPSALLSKT